LELCRLRFLDEVRAFRIGSKPAAMALVGCEVFEEIREAVEEKTVLATMGCLLPLGRSGGGGRCYGISV